MSAAEPQWPAWLRRHTGVEFLGPPRLFFAWTTIALSLLAILYVGAWNAAKYPVPLGYDAQPNTYYANVLLDQHHIPRADQSGESDQPPGYYFIAEVAARAGHEIFGWLESRPYTQLPEASYRGAQCLNVLLVLLTALCVLWLARLVAPRTPAVWASSVGFFAFLPVVAKTEAMFHPETLNMFLSGVALCLALRVVQRRQFGLRHLAPLGLVLIAGLLVRSSTLFTVIAVAIGLVVSFVAAGGRKHTRRTVLIAVVTLALVGAVGGIIVNRAPDLALGVLHPGTRTAVGSRSNFAHLPLGEMFRAPFRPHFVNAALPETYTEIWGDWIGALSWSSYDTTPWPPALRVMRDQNWIGVLPTVLAIAGWLMLSLRVFRGRRDLVVLAALPVVAVIGYLYRSYQFISADGDLFKATYLLTTAPVWALGFGVAYAALGRYRLLRLGVTACLVMFAVLELRFMLYGIRDHRPIF